VWGLVSGSLHECEALFPCTCIVHTCQVPIPLERLDRMLACWGHSVCDACVYNCPELVFHGEGGALAKMSSAVSGACWCLLSYQWPCEYVLQCMVCLHAMPSMFCLHEEVWM
jgi:hypothetical protein